MAKDRAHTAVSVAHEDYEAFDPANPEKNLLRAILLTAMADLKRSGDPARKAVEFFMSTEEDYIFSFRSICNHLEVDANQILVVTGLKRSINSPNNS